MLNLDVINLLVIIVAVINTLYGLIVYSRNRRDATNLSFFLLTICVSLWGVSMFIMRGFPDSVIATWGSRVLYASATLIPFASLYFAQIFPAASYRLTFAQRYLIPVPFTFAFLTALSPIGAMITGVDINTGPEPIIHFNLYLHSLYVLYIVGYFSWVYIILFKKFFHFTGVLRVQITFILIGTMVTTWIAVFTNLLLPYFGIYTLNWVGQIGILAMITSITYAILKHHLFNIKIIATEILVFGLCLLLFLQIFSSESDQARLVAAAIFFAAVLTGTLLVRSVIREVGQREEIQRLYKELEAKNTRLTELDTLKSQFLSIATHELRTPLTIVRNFVSLMIDGSYGKVPPAAEEAGRQVFERVNDMARSVDTYLNVSRIEQGKISYTFARTDFSRIVQLAVEGLQANADKKHLELSLSIAPGAESLFGNFDGPKLTEVVVNLLDNSIKYTPSGSVRVLLEKVGEHARLTIRDTGVGMSEKTKANLFKLFSPGDDAKKVNPASTGVGLYVSMAHVLAHKGTLTAHSDGVGKGSTFTLDLPLSKK